MQEFLFVSVILLWIVVLTSLVILLAVVRQVKSLTSPARPEMLKNGHIAPNFTAQTLDGKAITQENFYGAKQMMVFVAPNCEYCSTQMPKLDKLYSVAQSAKGYLNVLSLANAEDTKAYIEKLNFQSPILVAERDNNPLQQDYKVPGTPSYYMIDAKGKIAAGGFLEDNWEELTSRFFQGTSTLQPA